ncbi:MAG: DUF3080 family protein [Halieaceae bacterium]|jgi:hypothetical protein|nr:DUF3080 family protein [Halieaceae bacterium]
MPLNNCDRAQHGHYLRSPTRTGVLALALLALVMAACGVRGPDAAYDQYLGRLARTLATAPGQPETPVATALPAPRELHLAIQPGNLDALDFLALSGCAVQITIGKRNSSLGRLARDSQRLLLELEYLQLAPACIDYQRERGDNALADTLQRAWTLKRRQLPASIYNATLGGAEYREFWKKSPVAAADYPANTGSAVIASLEAINGHARRWLAGDFTADNRAFEILLGEVATGDGGALLQALAVQDGALTAANHTVEARLERGPLCSPGIRPAAADILPNVIRKYFIAGIQPRAAALNRRLQELMPPVRALEQMLGTALPPPYRQWRDQRDAGLARWADAPRRHVTLLQDLQRPCGTNPGQAGTPQSEAEPRGN